MEVWAEVVHCPVPVVVVVHQDGVAVAADVPVAVAEWEPTVASDPQLSTFL